MKRPIFFILLACSLVAAPAFAEDVVMAAFAPRSPVVLAQGGSFVAVASGYEALFTNPAGFASEKGSLTVTSLNPWTYGNPRDLLISAGAWTAPDDYQGPTTTFDDPGGVADYLEYASAGGVGAGESVGIGYVGKGLGLGFIHSTDFFLAGSPFPGGVQGYLSSEFALIGGLALTPVKSKFLTLSVGADLRPTIRFYTPLSAQTILDYVDAQESGASETDALNGSTLYQGAALALDTGLTARFGPDLTLALTIRDLFGTRYAMSAYGLGDWVASMESSGLPSGGDQAEDTYYVPMNIMLGAAYHFDLGPGSFWFDPTVHLELADPLGVIRDNESPWALLHVGMETRVLRLLKLRAGLNQGYLSAGAGIKFFFLDFNVAAFTREMGRYAGDSPSSGLTMDFAFRF